MRLGDAHSISMISLRNIAPLQAVKTGVAAAVSMYVANLLKLPQGY